MLEGSPENWLSNLYRHYCTDTFTKKLPLSPKYKKKISQIDELGLVSEFRNRNKLVSIVPLKSKKSIKIRDFVAEKHLNSMIFKSGLQNFVNKIKYDHWKDNLIEENSDQCDSQDYKTDIKRTLTTKNFKKNKKSFTTGEPLIKHSQTNKWNINKNSPKSKIKEINPLFFKKINEIVDKSKKFLDFNKVYSQKVNQIKKNLKTTKTDKIEKN